MHRAPESRGFLSFLLSSVFLFALVLAASNFTSQAPNLGYERLQSERIGQIATKQAFYSSISEAASSALAESELAGEGEPRNAVQFAIWHRAQSAQKELSDAGYDTIFFCGQASGQEMQRASLRMRQDGMAVLPSGTSAISGIGCVHSFDVDLLKRKIHIFGAGFCTYSGRLGMGYCDLFPPSFEVDF